MIEKKVSKDEFGDAWPLTVDSGTIINSNGAIIFCHEAQEYQLNGVATAQGYQAINPIWKNDPANPSAKINIGSLIKIGLNLR